MEAHAAGPSTSRTSPAARMTERLKVVHALAPARVGGLESVVTALSGGMAGRGHAVNVMAVLDPDAGEHEFVSGMERRGVALHPIEVPRRAYHREYFGLRDLLFRLGPDVVHTHGYRADVVASAAARGVGLPLVSTVHGFIGGGWKNRFYEWLQLRSLRRHEAVVAVSEPIRRKLLRSGLADRRIHLLRNAWSPDRPLLDRREARARLGLPQDSFVAGWVGRLSREKGADVFLEAMSRVADRGGEVTASLIGEGGRASSLRARTDRLGLGDRVRFHGRIPAAARLYRAFDVFVLSSRSEGTPISLLEAMDAEVPIVATRVGGVPDVVRDREEALLVPPEDPAAVAEAVLRVRRRPEDARRRARAAARRLAEEFALEPWLEAMEQIYREVLDAV